ncbi:MAG: T9SS type A sorting domain-containing protein, partial [Bacteroidia bacterium]|nr:T9SS type A sorting domain-containing protein [Bacteroidia bacterium]
EVRSVAGLTYHWAGPNNFRAVGSSISRRGVTPSDGGNYTVIATNGVCSSLAVTKNVVVLEAPTGISVQSNSPVCAGQNLVLEASEVAGATYSWSGPNGFSSTDRRVELADVSLSAGGYYTVVVSRGECGSEPIQVEVSVIPRPRTPVVSSNSPVCSGRVLLLNASSVGGATYVWSGPMGWSSNEQNPSIGNVSTAMSGEYTVMTVVGNCYSAPAVVNVQVRQTPMAPVASAVQSVLCAGQSLQLQASGGVGGSYVWSGPNSFSSGLQNPVRNNVSTLDSGTYTVYVTQNGCRSEISSVQVVVHSVPVVGSILHNSPVCVGAELSLSVAPQQGASYLWSGPAGFSSTVHNPKIVDVSSLQGGVYSVVVIQNGCTSQVGTVTVRVNNCSMGCVSPREISAVSQGSDKGVVSWQLPLSGSAVCYVVSYGLIGSDVSSWQQVLVPHPNRTVVIENLEPNKVYGVRVRTNCSTCSSSGAGLSEWSGVVTMTTGSSRIGGDLQSSLKVYPNPSSGHFEVLYESGRSGVAEVRVYDVSGRSVYGRLWELEEGSNILGLQLDLPAGVYVVELKHGDSIASLRIQIR